MLWVGAGVVVLGLAVTGALDAVGRRVFGLLGLGGWWRRLGAWSSDAREAAESSLERERSKAEGVFVSVTGVDPEEEGEQVTAELVHRRGWILAGWAVLWAGLLVGVRVLVWEPGGVAARALWAVGTGALSGLVVLVAAIWLVDTTEEPPTP